MSNAGERLRVLIPTTAGAVEVLLLTEEDPAVARSVACIGGTAETAEIDAAYNAFVSRPTGVVARLFGHPCYRLDVSGPIDAGSSWQLGVLIAHALHAVGRLAQEGEMADGVLWATGSVRAVDLTVGAVSHVPQKLAASHERLQRELGAGARVLMAVPAANAPDLGCLQAAIEAPGATFLEVATVQALWDRLALPEPEGLRNAVAARRLAAWQNAIQPVPAARARAAELYKSHAARPGAVVRSDPASETALLPFPDRPSIAVLPFANMSGDPEQEYFADGMVDDILMALSRISWLFVIARHSSFIYKVRSADVQQIGRELGVRYVVEGSVRKSDNRVRIVAQLIETETGAHIWADRYEDDLRDIFALQDEITERIVSAVEENVRDAEIRRARAKPTDSLTAYDFYLRALPAWFGQTEVEYKRTQVLLGKALDVDPEYAEALGTLTDSVNTLTIQGWHESWSRGVDEAFRLAGLALAAGPDNSTCLASAAFTYGVLSNRFDEALELANRAVMVHPNSVFVRNRAAAVYVKCGESDKAIAQCEAASRMNPLDSKKAATVTFTILSFALYMARRFEESIRAGRRALVFTPQSNIARRYVAISLAQLGRTDEARAEIAELLKHQPSASLAAVQQQAFFRHQWMKELQMEGLRKAGLREE
jgi:adenylate cyclase